MLTNASARQVLEFLFCLKISFVDTNDKYEQLAVLFADNKNTQMRLCAPGSSTACECLSEKKGGQQIKPLQKTVGLVL